MDFSPRAQESSISDPRSTGPAHTSQELYLLGVGHFHPETVIDNSFLTALNIGTSEEWILERVGIARRRTVLPLDYIAATRNSDPSQALAAARYNAADLALKAAIMALERAQISPQELELCVGASSIPQMCIPSLGCLVAARLGVQIPAFDLNSACSSFVAQIHFLQNVPIDGPILLVQSETYTLATHYNDRTAAVLWGDGASAAIISRRRKGRARVAATTFGSNPLESNAVVIPYCGHFSQQGSRVQRFAITQTVQIFNSLPKPTTPVHFIGHQANLRMLETAVQRMNPSPQHRFNVDEFGNCGAAGAPSVLSQNWDFYTLGDTLILATVGAGLSWGGIVFEFR
jgi:3-oxoacyl-[acyl-carrier-protein] synthase-3